MKATNHVQWGSITVSTDRLSFLDRLFIGASLAGLLVWALPHMAFAQTVQNLPMSFEIQNQNSLQTPSDALAPLLSPDVSLYPATVVDPRVASLQAYLEGKGSPLAAHAEFLFRQYHYRLIIGIAFAESNFCRRQIAENNCWGIGGSHPESYTNLDTGIARANQLIQKYYDLGMRGPQLMRNTWVGENIGDPNWTIAVTQVAQEMESQGL